MSTNADRSFEIETIGLQLGLNFADTTPELFAGKEMGEDALRVLQDYRKLYGRICADIKPELSHVRETMSWAKRL